MSGLMKVVVNADDFGLSTRVNSEVERLHQAGVLTSATIMSNGPALEEVVEIQRRNARLGLGIHLNASNFTPVSFDIRRSSLCDSRGVFHLDFRNRFKRHHQSLLIEEWTEQIRRVQAMGIRVDHLDSHHHVHTWPLVFPVLKRVSLLTGIRWIRNTRNLVPNKERRGSRNFLKYSMKSAWSTWLKWNGMFTTHSFCSVHDLRTILALGEWKPTKGSLELMCHPGDDRNPEYVEEVIWMESNLQEWVSTHGEFATFGTIRS